MQLVAAVCLLATFAVGASAGEGAVAAVFAVRESGAQRRFQLLPSGRAIDETTGSVLKVQPEVSVKIARLAGVPSIARKYNALGWRQDVLGGFYALSFADRAMAFDAAARMNADGMTASLLVERRKHAKFSPKDTLLPQQWHLRNNGSRRALKGADLNVQGAWKTVRGKGVRIAIVDDGLELKHPDLAKNTSRLTESSDSLHYDFNRDRENPAPSRDDFHGTAVAGLAAAAANSIGGVGVAPRATLIGLRLIGGATSDRTEARALKHRNDRIHVYNNSWGPDDTGVDLEAPGPLLAAALQRAARYGRRGKGNIFVWAAGNGRADFDDSNYDGYANSVETIAIGSVSDLGKQTDYGEPGANIVAVAPSSSLRRQGLTTTDRSGRLGYNSRGDNDGTVLPAENLKDNDYTNDFGGTSGAAPLLSGVVALMLEANKNLGWREVQDVLIRTAQRNDRSDSDWKRNGAGLWFNHKYGAGSVDASAAVATAEKTERLGAALEVIKETEGSRLPARIPDNDKTGLEVSFDLSGEKDLKVEHVRFSVSVDHGWRGDLRYILTSPSGMKSIVESRPFDRGILQDWTFMSIRHWGESSAGVWKLRVIDEGREVEGLLESAKILVRGTLRTKTKKRIR